MVSGGNGIIRTFPPLPRTRNCASLSSRSSSSSARTSHARNPPSTNKPPTAMSRAVRKLDQNLATCSTDNGSMTRGGTFSRRSAAPALLPRSEEHTSELQSPCNLVCRLLLEKKKTPVPAPPAALVPCGRIPTRRTSPVAAHRPARRASPRAQPARSWYAGRPPRYFFNDPAPTDIYPLSLHDALPIWAVVDVEPLSNDWTTRRMGNARKALSGR